MASICAELGYNFSLMVFVVDVTFEGKGREGGTGRVKRRYVPN